MIFAQVVNKIIACNPNYVGSGGRRLWTKKASLNLKNKIKAKRARVMVQSGRMLT
jgi:hypothetical protein